MHLPNFQRSLSTACVLWPGFSRVEMHQVQLSTTCRWPVVLAMQPQTLFLRTLWFAKALRMGSLEIQRLHFTFLCSLCPLRVLMLVNSLSPFVTSLALTGRRQTYCIPFGQIKTNVLKGLAAGPKTQRTTVVRTASTTAMAGHISSHCFYSLASCLLPALHVLLYLLCQ